MRQAIGQTWILQLVILFILLFVGYITLTLNYNRTIRLKNEIVTMIEKYEGLNDYSIDLVNNYLSSNLYDGRGSCVSKAGQQGVYGGDIKRNILEEAQAGEKYNYCIKKYQGLGITNYYQITIFYKFNLPVIGNLSGFTIKGTTNSFKSYDNNEYENLFSN